MIQQGHVVYSAKQVDTVELMSALRSHLAQNRVLMNADDKDRAYQLVRSGWEISRDDDEEIFDYIQKLRKEINRMSPHGYEFGLKIEDGNYEYGYFPKAEEQVSDRNEVFLSVAKTLLLGAGIALVFMTVMMMVASIVPSLVKEPTEQMRSVVQWTAVATCVLSLIVIQLIRRKKP